jgi:tetratricopeptide (TPR) repeat protein
MTFVGQERHEMVERLLSDFDYVTSGKGPKVVLLASPPGWGKTRVVQEFYRRIAAKQSSPQYWPAELVDTRGLSGDSSSMNTLLQARKLVYPQVVNVPKGSAMDWMWWGVLCHRRGNGEYAEAMFDSVAQMNAHAGAIASPKKGQTLDITLNLVGVLGALGVVAIGAPLGAALAVTGAGASAFNNRDIIAQLKSWRDRRKGSEISLGREHAANETEELGRNLAQTTRNKPLVLVIDDAHDADDSLLKILEVLIAEQAKVLIILTTWPGFLSGDQNRPLSTWWSNVTLRRDAMLRRENLQTLSAVDLRLVAIDDGLIGEADVSTLEGNILALRGALRLPAVQREIEAGRIPDLSRYSKGPDAVFHEYWDDLPRPVRHVLAIAAQTGTQYVPPLVTAAALLVGITDAQQHLVAGIDVYSLAREIDATLHAFTDSILYAVAQRRGKEHELSDHDYRAIRTAISAAVLDPDLLESLSTEARLAVRRQHVALVREGFQPSDDSAALSAMEVAHAEASRYSYQNASELTGLAIKWRNIPCDHVEILSMRNDQAKWMGKGGKDLDALPLFQGILADCIMVLGPDHKNTLKSRYQIAHLLSNVGRTNEAIEMLDELLRDQMRVLGPDHHHSIGTAHDAALLRADVGRVEESIELLLQSVADHERVMGKEQRDTLSVRCSLAGCLGEIGRKNEAVARLTDLLDDCLQFLGPDHRETHRVRGNLAYWLGEIGMVDEALYLTTVLLDDRIRVFGPDHSSTLVTRLNIAGLLCDLNNFPEAVRQYNTLLNDHIRINGPQHHNTIRVRHNLAYTLGIAGQPELAIEQMSVVLEDRLRLLGPDHPYTLTTQHNMATFIADSGKLDEAIKQLLQVEVDRTRVLGPKHPDTYGTRLYLVHLLILNHQPEVASAQLEVLVDEMSINLGLDHDDTLVASEILQDLRLRGI